MKGNYIPLNPDKFDELSDEQKATNSGQLTSGEGADIAGPQTTLASTPASNKSSGSFTNLNQYVEANKDQGAGLGGKIQQNVEKSAQEGASALGESVKQYNQAQDAAGVNPENFSTEKVQSFAQKALSSPSKVGQSDIDSFNEARTKSEALTSGKDTAPKTLTELNTYQDAKGKLQTTAEKAQSTGTEGGREQLLQETFKRPNYTKGQSTFDQLLTQNVPGNKAKFESLRENLLGQYGLASQDAAAIQAAADKRNEVVTNTKQSAANIQEGLLGEQGVLTKYQTDLLAKPDQLKTGQQTKIDQKKDSIREYLLNNYGPKPFGMDLESLVNSTVSGAQPTSNINIQNAISRGENSDLAKLQVLNKLAGRESNLLGENVLSETGDQFNTDINVDEKGLGTKIQDRKNIVSNDIISKANQTLNKNIVDFNGESKPVEQASSEALSMIFTPRSVMRVQEEYAKEATKANDRIVNELAGQLADINNYRKQNGLAPVSVTKADWEPIYNVYKTNALNRRLFAGQINTAIDVFKNPGKYPNVINALISAAVQNAMIIKFRDLKVNPLMGDVIRLPSNTRSF